MKNITLKLNDFFMKEVDIIPLEKPSKNDLYLIKVGEEKYLLKVYNSKKFNVELKAIQKLSKEFKEIPKLITYNIEDKWILTEYFDYPTLREKNSKKFYRNSINLLIKLQKSQVEKKNPLFFYDEKIEESKKRIATYLPGVYNKKEIVTILNNLYKTYPIIKNNAVDFVHGDFVNRNILVGKELKIIDFENSHRGHRSEDLFFFIESIPSKDRENTYNYYTSKFPFKSKEEKICLIMKIIIKLRYLGSLLRLKNKNLEKYSERIENYVKSIINNVKLLSKYNLDLLHPQDNHWDDTFSKNKDLFNEPHKYLMKIDLSNVKDALDLGCGTGRNLIFLCKKGIFVTGVDNSKEAIEILRKKMEAQNLDCKLNQTDFYQKFPFEDQSFDLVISCQAIHHNRIKNIKKVLNEIYRVLRENGKIFITLPKIKDLSHKAAIEIEENTFIPYSGHETGIVHHYFTKEEISRFFKKFNFIISEDKHKHYVILGRKILTQKIKIQK